MNKALGHGFITLFLFYNVKVSSMGWILDVIIYYSILASFFNFWLNLGSIYFLIYVLLINCLDTQKAQMQHRMFILHLMEIKFLDSNMLFILFYELNFMIWLISGIEIDMYKETSGLEMDTAGIIPGKW